MNVLFFIIKNMVAQLWFALRNRKTSSVQGILFYVETISWKLRQVFMVRFFCDIMEDVWNFVGIVDTWLAYCNRPMLFAILDTTVLLWSNKLMSLSEITSKNFIEEFLLIFRFSIFMEALMLCHIWKNFYEIKCT